MRWFVNAMFAGLATTTLLTSPVSASTIYAGPSSAMATDQSLALHFSYGSGTAAVSFVIDGYKSLDGKNAYEDDFSLKLNNQQVFLGTFNLGGGSNSGSQANVYSNPFGASFSNLTNNGTGIGWNGGKELINFVGLPLKGGLNTLTFTYTSLSGPGYAGFQGLGDEGWGIEKVSVGGSPVAATPLPPAWTMLLIGLGGFGFLAHPWQRKESCVGNRLV